MKKITAGMICFLMILMSIHVSYAGFHEGEYEGVEWCYDNGVMTFQGGDYMPQDEDVPWYDYIEGTRKLIIKDSFPKRDDESAFEGYTILREVVFDTNYCWARFMDSPNLKTARYTTEFPFFMGAAYINCRLDKVFFDNPKANYVVRNNMLMNKDQTELYYYLGSRTWDVTVPDGIEIIHEGAFAGCYAKAVKLPSTLRVIEGWAFANSSIRSITIPASCQRIGACAFSGCIGLREVRFLCDHVDFYADTYGFAPGAISRKGGYTFSGCTLLREITLPGCDEIPDGFFHGCTDLRRVYFGDGTKKLTSNPEESLIFYQCKKLQKVYIPDNMEFEKITFKDAYYPTILCHKDSKAAKLVYKYQMKYEYIK